MRTTVRLDDDLLRAVKRYAAERQLTLTAVLEQALREMLALRQKLERRQPVRLPTFKGRGLQSGVDLNDSAALLNLMERAEVDASH